VQLLEALADARLREAFRKEKSTPIAPSLLLDFEGDKQLDPRITFTRASTATFYDQNGVLQTAAAGVARFDHDPVTGESLGLLIEEQRTNLLTRSEEFDDAVWTKTRASITANTVVAPDGTLTGDKLFDDTTASNTHQIARAISWTSGVTYTRTLYAKAAEYTRFRFQLPSNAFGTAINASFDLQNGTVVSVTSPGTATITPVGNGWYRCSVTATATATVSETEISCGLIQGSNTSYTGDGFSGIFIWGAQLEAAATPSSYIPTTSATVTRSADAAVMTGANFSSWFRADEGTLYTEASRPFAVPSGQFPRVFELSDGTSNNSIRNGYSTNTTASFVVVVSIVNQAVISPSATVSLRKLAGAYKVDDFAASANGGTVSTDTSGTIPVVDRAAIGSTGISAFLNGHIRKIAYYTSRLPNATLQAMTS